MGLTIGIWAAPPVLVPEIEGDFWQVAGDPDLGKYTTAKQQPVDFGIWQAADGTWQLWSCIRATAAPGKTRLFYRWQARNLTDKDWTPMGIAMMADPNFGETEGGLQAPFVLKEKSVYYMFYGNWEHIALATSVDGKTFARQLTSDGGSGMFGEETGSNTRDPMVLKIGSLYYCYYTAFPNRHGADFVRTSKDKIHWSAARKVAYGGSKGDAHIRPNARLSIITRLRATTICCEINSTERKRSLPFTARVIRSISGRTTTGIWLRLCRMRRQKSSNPQGSSTLPRSVPI